VSIVPTNLAASMAAASSVERPEVREKDRKDKVRAGTRAGGQRDADQVVVGLETAEAVRNLGGNTEEQTREDRESHPAYDPGGRLGPSAGRPHLDIQG
jgi:hypothetical protein